jgi:hypothetical protein
MRIDGKWSGESLAVRPLEPTARNVSPIEPRLFHFLLRGPSAVTSFLEAHALARAICSLSCGASAERTVSVTARWLIFAPCTSTSVTAEISE